jgi:prolyl-tRNA editing enzyme YbaK/EbsC (Cys-tRNA(Pro) deacylase)
LKGSHKKLLRHYVYQRPKAFASPPPYPSAAAAADLSVPTMTAKTLEERVTALERARFSCPPDVHEVDESMRRARSAVEGLGLYSSRWVWVPEPYYTWSMEKRAEILKSPRTGYLCKSLLLENKKVTDESFHFALHPRFVLVVLQYDAELSTDLLTTSIRRLRLVSERLDPTSSNFDWRVADPEDNDRITGYKFNSVTPFGLKEDVPIILSSSVADLGYLWLGGGQ